MTPSNHADASAGCTAGYMYLFQIDSAEVHTFILMIIEQIFSANGFPAMFRVDGVRDTSDNKWYYYSKGSKTPAYAGLKWLVSSDTLTGSDTMIATNMAYPVIKVFRLKLRKSF
jgi:hypothetical protein